MKNEGIVGYDLFDVKIRKSVPFLRTEGEAGWQKVGPYFFLPRGLRAARAAILGFKPGEILIVDEVGPMELAGRGVWSVLTKALSRPAPNGLLVVRRPLLNDLLSRLGRAPVTVFDVGQREVYRSLTQALSELVPPERNHGQG